MSILFIPILLYSAASFIVNVSLRWIGTRTLFSIHNGNSFSSLPLIDTPLYCKLQGVFRSLSFIGFFPFQIFIKKSFNQTIVSCNLTGVSPLRGSRAALPIACDALNARTMAIREYHYVSCVLSPISCYTYFTTRCWSLIPSRKSWRTRRMARRKRNVSDLPYAASPLSCVAFFVKEQKGRIEIGSGKGGRCRVYLIP